MKLDKIVAQSAVEAVKSLYGQDVPLNLIQVQKTRPEFEGNMTLVIFPLLKISRKKPEDTAREIGEYIVAHNDFVENFSIVKGFLNFTFRAATWLSMLQDIDQEAHFGEKPVTEESPLAMVEYSSPNTNKPLHLGHVRNNLLGWSLARILEANGNRVVKTNIVNDRGIHICKSMLAWQKWGDGITPEAAHKKGDHLIGDFYVLFDKHYREEVAQLQAEYEAGGMGADEAKEKAKQEAPLIKEAHEMLVKWEQGDKEVRNLWQKMNSWVYAGFDETYKALGVAFDKIYYESETYLVGKRKVMDGLERGLFFKKEDESGLGRPHPGGPRPETADPRRRHLGLYDAGYRYGHDALQRLSHRQDDLRRGQRAELPLPGALAPARPPRLQVGQGPGPTSPTAWSTCPMAR